LVKDETKKQRLSELDEKNISSLQEWQQENTSELEFNTIKLDYYYMKVKYFQLFKDLDNSRRFLYKIDLFIRDQM
jgi:hypothetical protein